MSNIEELQLRTAGLEATSGVAMSALGLEQERFAWFTGSVHYPMAPQEIIPDQQHLALPKIMHDTYSSRVTYYGGKAVNMLGNFSCGHIQAHIAEPIPEGAKHLSGDNVLPAPYITRILELHNGILTVDTPTKSPSVNDGPLVVEGAHSNPRFRNVTIYNADTGEITVRHGEHFTHGHGWGIDKTTTTSATELSQELLDLRLATMLRTIGAAAMIFDRIISNDTEVDLKVVRDDPFAGK